MQVVLPTFLIIAAGYFIGKKKKVDTKPFNDLIIYITGPALILTNLIDSNLNLQIAGKLSLASLLVMVGLGFITITILKAIKSKRRGVILPISVGNTGNLGYPIALFAFGTEGLARAVIFNITNGLILFSIGVYILSNKKSIKEAFKLPLLHATILGIILNISGTPIPEIIFKPLEMIGIITIPLALLLLGYDLTRIKVTSLKTAAAASLLRIAGGFALGFIIAAALGLQGIDRGIVLLLAAQPAAVMSMILCQKYKQDAELAASIVFISTLLSMISIPIILSIV